MKKIIYIFFSLLLVSNIVSAQIYPYFSIKKTNTGLMIGVEVINQKTNLVLNPKNYSYSWTVPSVSLIPSKASNIFSIPLTRLLKTISINLQISRAFSKENYSYTNYVFDLPPLKAYIVRIHSGILLPLVPNSNLNKDDILTVLTENFSSQSLDYLWSLNGALISDKQEVPVSAFENKSGILRVTVSGDLPWERVETFININVK